MKHFSIVIYFFLCSIGFLKAQYNSGIIIEKILKTDTTVSGQRIEYPKFENQEVSILKVTIPPGDSTGWHKHSIPVFAYVLSGKLTVETYDGKKREFAANTCFAEVFDTFHNGYNNEEIPLILIAFYLGEKGKALSQKK